jgi:hypothetical protein
MTAKPLDLGQLFGTSSRLETEGVDLHLGGDCYITIRRAGGSNRAFLETFRRVTAPHRRAIERGTLDPDTDDELGIKIFAEAIIVEWRGVVVNGQAVEFSKEAFVRVMHELPDLWRLIRDEARNASNFRDEEVADAGKSSPTA